MCLAWQLPAPSQVHWLGISHVYFGLSQEASTHVPVFKSGPQSNYALQRTPGSGLGVSCSVIGRVPLNAALAFIMAVWRFVDSCVPEAQRLADLTGVANDLQRVRCYCAHLMRMLPPRDLESLDIALALCIAALATYGRTLVHCPR